MLESWQFVPNYQIGTHNKTPKTKNSSIVRGVRYHNRVYRQLKAWLQRQDDPALTLYVEPWLRSASGSMCQPDAVILDTEARCAMVVEAKLNWKDGRDEKLRTLYLPAVSSAFGVEVVWPVLITQNIQYLNREAHLGLSGLVEAMAWREGDVNQVILLP